MTKADLEADVRAVERSIELLQDYVKYLKNKLRQRYGDQNWSQ